MDQPQRNDHTSVAIPGQAEHTEWEVVGNEQANLLEMEKEAAGDRDRDAQSDSAASASSRSTASRDHAHEIDDKHLAGLVQDTLPLGTRLLPPPVMALSAALSRGNAATEPEEQGDAIVSWTGVSKANGSGHANSKNAIGLLRTTSMLRTASHQSLLKSPCLRLPTGLPGLQHGHAVMLTAMGKSSRAMYSSMHGSIATPGSDHVEGLHFLNTPALL